MIKNRTGFTLIELLIAATIIGILAVFATIAYRNSAAQTRVAGAKAKADSLAWAVQRYKLDPVACLSITSNSNLTIANLINCGLLESGSSWTDEYFTYEICNGSGSNCSGSGVSSDALACMSGQSSKLPSQYLKSKGYWYCVGDVSGAKEHLGTN